MTNKKIGPAEKLKENLAESFKNGFPDRLDLKHIQKYFASGDEDPWPWPSQARPGQGQHKAAKPLFSYAFIRYSAQRATPSRNACNTNSFTCILASFRQKDLGMMEMKQDLQGFRGSVFAWRCKHQNVTLSLCLSSFLKNGEFW